MSTLMCTLHKSPKLNSAIIQPKPNQAARKFGDPLIVAKDPFSHVLGACAATLVDREEPCGYGCRGAQHESPSPSHVPLATLTSRHFSTAGSACSRYLGF
ncbi:hypothetical protein JTE90_004739 [Oedothorax gibbosus]|uniref:Uncharacterized protein n=1 Tax=Oedothorax gibbosus TaxID=931172 RepID=A0AAV6TXL3_9ARAC|nr:hypothetical protein JTE90_004739 [Oedothorax gibbosus]